MMIISIFMENLVAFQFIAVFVIIIVAVLFCFKMYQDGKKDMLKDLYFSDEITEEVYKKRTKEL